MPESKRGNRYCLVVVDYFSRYAVVVPIPNKSASTVAAALMDRVVLLFGHPGTLLSDNGTEFANELLRRLCEKIGTRKVFTTPYRPQADGMVERFNRTLLRLLSCFVDDSQQEWDEVLPYVLYAYNTAVSRVTGMSPFTLVFGCDPRPAIYADVLDETGQIRTATDPRKWAEDVKEFLSEDFLAEVRLKDVEEKARRNRNLNVDRKELALYQPGTLVLVANKKALADGAKLKLARKHRGLHVVLDHSSPVTLVLRKVGDQRRKLVKLHVDNVEGVRKNKRAFIVLKLNKAVDEVKDNGDQGVDDDHEDYELESVQGLKVEKGVLYVKVRWKGYDEDEDSWVKDGDLDCAALLDDFVAMRGGELFRVK